MIPVKNVPIASVLSASLLLAGCGAVFVNKGSKQEPLTDGLRDPSAVQVKVNVPADQKIIGNFDDGSTKMNPKLFGSNSGTWTNFTYGGNTINSPFVVAGGANGTPMGVHIFGTLNNKGDGTYPAFTVQGKLKESGYFDASPFSGVRFYYKCPGADKAPARRFAITIAPTLPSSNGGTCATDCYNHFGADLSMGDWSRMSYAFTDLKRQSGWGSAVLPPELNEHLKEFVGFEWAHNAGNTAGSYAIDYWLDEVEFF
jgi:hypothetical protein